MCVSKNNGTTKASILIGFSGFPINHPFWGIIIFGNTHIRTVLLDCRGPFNPWSFWVPYYRIVKPRMRPTLQPRSLHAFEALGEQSLVKNKQMENGGTMEDVSMLVCCCRISQMNFDDGICENGSLSNSIHVWYIYLYIYHINIRMFPKIGVP